MAPAARSSNLVRQIRAFTLVELLVVVGIIGVVVSILLPSLSSARQQSYTVKCSSNLKQIGVAWVIYAENSNDTMVPGRMPNIAGSLNIYTVGNGDQYRPRWFVQLGAESGVFAYSQPSIDPADDNTKLVDNELFLCAARSDWNNNRNSAYGYNFHFLGNSRLKAGGTTVADAINFPVRYSFLTHASSTVVAADNLGTAATYAETGRRPYNNAGQNNALDELGNHGWSLDPPRLTTTGDFCDNNNRNVARSGPDPRHSDRANFLFADTHVDTTEPRTVGYDPLEDGSYPMPGLGGQGGQRSHNRMFSGTGQDADPPVVDGGS